MAFFTESTITFLEDLAEHNHRDWFEANKKRYEADVREPALALIRALAPRVEAVAPHFRADDRKVGGSLMRIHRDVRFSKDKRPYKTNVGIQLRHVGGADVHAPGIYIHVEPGHSFVGFGLWMPDPPVLDAIRQRIVSDPSGYGAIVNDPKFKKTFTRDDHGESLKKAPKGYPADHPHVDDLKRKSHLASAELTRADVLSAQLDAVIADRLNQGRPYLKWLCEAVGAEL
jgi:uncharacterized protein (TIGR02453 family)